MPYHPLYPPQHMNDSCPSFARCSKPILAGDEVQLGAVFLRHLSRQPSSSAIRSSGDGFVIDWVLERLDPHDSTGSLDGLLNDWIDRVPKTLWELGSKNEDASNRLLTFLLTIGNRGVPVMLPKVSGDPSVRDQGSISLIA